MPMSPRLLRPLASRSLSDADATAYLAAVEAADGQALEPAVRNAVTAFVVNCKSDGIWDAIKASCILAGARTLAGALVPLKGAAPTNNNFVSGDYNRETGLLGNGSTKYLDSNRNNNADPQDSSHIAVYASSLDANGAVVGVYLGAGGSGVTGSTMLVEQGSNVLRVRSRSATLTSSSQNEAVGFMAVARPDASNISVRSDGGTSSHAVASETPANADYFVFGTNNSGLANATDARLAFYSIGESLDLSALDTRVAALIAAIGNAL